MFGLPGFLECLKVDSQGQLRSQKESSQALARNCDESKWSERYKNWLNTKAKKKADEYISKHESYGGKYG